jgi:hypothetical protein
MTNIPVEDEIKEGIDAAIEDEQPQTDDDERILCALEELAGWIAFMPADYPVDKVVSHIELLLKKLPELRQQIETIT